MALESHTLFRTASTQFLSHRATSPRKPHSVPDRSGHRSCLPYCGLGELHHSPNTKLDNQPSAPNVPGVSWVHNLKSGLIFPKSILRRARARWDRCIKDGVRDISRHGNLGLAKYLFYLAAYLKSKAYALRRFLVVDTPRRSFVMLTQLMI
jgi:hypothetical protein